MSDEAVLHIQCSTQLAILDGSVTESMARHSRQDALSDQQFKQLLDACDQLDEPYQTETTFAVMAGGRLGMRAGEIAHVKKEWVDWQRKQINIPLHEPCEKGNGGEICGYCRFRAEESMEHSDLTREEAEARRWEPKTEHSSRAIPFGFNDHVEAVVTAFFDTHDEWPRSRVGVNRRVERAADESGIDVYPHALRATAATHHAYRGLPVSALQSLFGWADISIAQKYLRLSGGATSKALNETHND